MCMCFTHQVCAFIYTFVIFSFSQAFKLVKIKLKCFVYYVALLFCLNVSCMLCNLGLVFFMCLLRDFNFERVDFFVLLMSCVLFLSIFYFQFYSIFCTRFQFVVCCFYAMDTWDSHFQGCKFVYLCLIFSLICVFCLSSWFLVFKWIICLA